LHKSAVKKIIYLKKTRPDQEKVEIESVQGDDVSGKKVLIVDDMITTGRTIIQASHVLKQLGAKKISAAVTHGVFSEGSYQKLQDSDLHKIYVTNTLDCKSIGKVEVVDISQFIENLLKIKF